MHFSLTRFIFWAFLTLLIGFPSILCQAADYPSKPITLLVGYPPGGGTDLAARLVSGYFSKKWGQQILVVNKPGGNVVPCVVEMYKAKPDGYTLMMDTNGASSIQTAIMRDLPFKLEDRIFLTNFIINPTFYFCGANKLWKTLKEAGDYAKRDPANFKWAAMDISSTTTLSIIQFLDAIGVDISKTKKMDFKGGPDVMVAGANGEVDLANYGIGPALPLIESGRIHPLALISPQRIKRLPNLPTVREEGFPGLTAAQWCGVSGPPKLPKEIVAKWDQEMKKAATDPEFMASIEKLGMIMYHLSSDAYKKMVLDEMKIFTDLAQKIGVRPR
jgi:tripartite-type tricarboxylate transporter receptor subunit TctC